jgi:hypothetical protein
MKTGQKEPDRSTDIDRLIVRAIGEELRRARTTVGWSRPGLVNRMNSDLPVNTYACYEQGVRRCSIPRLVEICCILGVAAPELLGLALQRAGLGLDAAGGVRVDLNKVLADNQVRLRPLRRWARNRLQAEPEQDMIRLDRDLIKELAIFLKLTPQDLLGALLAYTPDAAPQGAG